MITFSVKIKSIQFIPELKLTTRQTKEVGVFAIKTLINRVQNKYTDVHDTQMPPYSSKPIYVKVGTAKGKVVLKSGRVVIAPLNKSVKVIDIRQGGSKGKFKNSIVRGKGYIRFPNRATYKRYLGHSGNRDLTETGKMLGAIVILSATGVYAKIITLGFRDIKQEGKARGNAAIADWMGLSPSDQIKVVKLVNSIFEENLKLPSTFQSSKLLAGIS